MALYFSARSRDLLDRRDVAVHRIEALEHDQLGALERLGGEQFFEMGDVVMPPDLALAAGAAHALDHRIVVERVGEDQAIGQQVGDGRNGGEIGDPAGGEDQRRLLAVQVGEFGFELDERMAGAGNVAGAAGAGAVLARAARSHRRDDFRVDAHAEIIVGAPDGDVMRRSLRPAGARWRAGKRAASRSRSAKTR